jgi:hypothetical protein
MNKEFWKAALTRAFRTVCQTALALIGTATFMQDLNWIQILSASCLSGVVSILTSVVTGLPEAPKTNK